MDFDWFRYRDYSIYKDSTSCSLNPAASWCSGLMQTASYSMAKGPDFAPDIKLLGTKYNLLIYKGLS